MNKTIHYCWFGKGEKSPIIKKCIQSWRTYFPDWNIVEWNETNCDINAVRYTRQAYDAKKYAFVSDYFRFKVLDEQGGLYFDTDVEVIRSFGSLLDQEAFSGFETEEYVAPGLVLYSKEPNHPIIHEARQWYENHSFLDENGTRIRINVCGMFTEILSSYGLKKNGNLQSCGGMKIFPKEYFCPFDDATGVLTKTQNTFAIHWYAKSWMSKKKIIRNKITRILHRFFGVDIKQKLLRLIDKS